MERTLETQENVGSKVTQQGRAERGPDTRRWLFLPSLPQQTQPHPSPSSPSQFSASLGKAWAAALCHLSSLSALGREPMGVGVLSFPSLALCCDFSMETGSGRGGDEDIWNSEWYQISIIKCLFTQQEEGGMGEDRQRAVPSPLFIPCPPLLPEDPGYWRECSPGMCPSPEVTSWGMDQS